MLSLSKHGAGFFNGLLDAAAFKEASALAEEISRMLQSLRKRIRERVAAAR